MSTGAESTWLSGERVLITGGDGMLARGFREVLAGCPNAAVLALSRQELDITDQAAVRAVRAWRPSIVVHCAALALADKCEREPELGRAVLIDGTRNVVDLCCSTGARLLFPQSVFIFDGRDLPVTEETEPFPPFTYGHFKLEAERLVLESVADALVIRMAGFFGGDDRDKNFVGLFTRNLRSMLARGQSSCEVGDRVWQPTYTVDHARNSILLLDRRCTGIYHMGSSGEASFYDVAQACIEELRLQSVITIQKCPAEIVSATEPARRPLRMVTATVRLDREGLNLHRPWRAGLGAYLSRPYFADLRSQGGSVTPSRNLCEAWVHPLLGAMQSRVVMSAMTRGFAGTKHTATEAMAAYYARRAEGGVGLILTEGTIVHHSADGYRNVPHIETKAQRDSWRRVVDAVHEARGKIACQLWHCGRISHPDFLGGGQPISSTDRAAEGINRQNDKPYGLPRRLGADELPGIVAHFRRAAANAMEAGFDAVEVHLGHGYLPDQFLDARVNDRTDAYGGSVENRCRFPLELMAGVLAECGAVRVLARISPARDMNGPYDWPNLDEMLAYFIPALDATGVRMLDVSCARAEYHATSGRVIRQIRPQWPHLLVGGASLTQADAQRELDAGWVDLVTYGRWALANPDLVRRFRAGEALVPFETRMQLELS